MTGQIKTNKSNLLINETYLPPPPVEFSLVTHPTIPNVLPHEKMYTIQIGDTLFKLSGASLSFDSPSYFTEYFLKNADTTCVSIDRSPKVFKKIYMHLQGYSIKVNDEYEFVYLLMDSNYFRLNKLRERLLQDGVFVSISGKSFKIPKHILVQKGNYPNYFSVIYNNMLQDPFITGNLFIRPPPLTPYSSPRSSKIFGQLLCGLHGNSVRIENEENRKDLISDCRYYQFFALEQKLINHKISKNPFTGREEITIRFEDIKKNGLLNGSNDETSENEELNIVKYSRPFVDENIYRDLIIQIDSSDVNLMVNPSMTFTNLLIVGKTAITLKNILAKISDDYMFEDEGNEPKLTVLIQLTESVGKLNGMSMEQGWLKILIDANVKEINQSEEVKIIMIKLLKSQWTIHVQGRNKIWMNCLKFEGMLDKVNYNSERVFL